MSISYSAITNYGKITLPSVESFGTNMNILRDPPRSITTRRIDKVGATSEITTMIDESASRISGLNEYILQYARGVNPMVAVSFDNTNIGAHGAAQTSKQTFLPYRIMNGGAFRPPIKDQRDILPLSRLPRVWTSSYTNPGFADFSKKAMCFNPDIETKGVKNSEDLIRPCVSPNAIYSLEMPVLEPLGIKNNIKSPLKVEVSSGKESRAQINAKQGTPVKQVKENLKVPVVVNQKGTYKKEGENKVNIEKYTRDVLKGEMSTNNSRNIFKTDIEDVIHSNANQSVKSLRNIDYTVNKIGPDKTEYIHKEVETERNLPYYEGRTNTTQNIHKQMESIQAREYTQNRPVVKVETNIRGQGGFFEEEYGKNYNLRPTLNLGGMDSLPTMPEQYHENQTPEFDKIKQDRRRKVYDMQMERNSEMNSIPWNPALTPV